MEFLATGLLSTGLQQMDRVLICGYNHSQVMLSALGAVRAGLVFSLVGSNFNSPQQLQHLLSEVSLFQDIFIFCSGRVQSGHLVFSG